ACADAAPREHDHDAGFDGHGGRRFPDRALWGEAAPVAAGRHAPGVYRRHRRARERLRRDVWRGTIERSAGEIRERRFLGDHRADYGGRECVDRRRGITGRYDDRGGAPPMKVLTAAEMREVDRRTIELGIPGVVLMENAA